MASNFVWYELMTTDVGAATAFYANLLGWEATDVSQPGMAYHVFTIGGERGAGAMTLPEPARQNGARPGWGGYIGVDDVDAAADKLKGLGGQVHMGPADIPGVGRFAAVSDPQGVMFTLFRGDGEAGSGPDQAVGWRELFTGDREAAFGFYAAMFGWTKGEAHDMGAHGIYQLFLAGGPEPLGGMMSVTVHPTGWNYYLRCASVTAAKEIIEANGGKVMMGPMQVPSGDWVLMGADPQGAVFALISAGA
jgi:predicted enzyme related to lactoylglutathione lyase